MLRESDTDSEIPTEPPAPSLESTKGAEAETSSSDISADITQGLAESDASTGFWPVLQNRNFLVLWSGQVFSQLADKVYLVLMVAIIGSQFETPGQTISGWVSAVMVAFTIPAVLFGSLAGVYVDRWSKQGVMVSTNLLRGALVVALPLILWLSRGLGTVAHLPTGFWLLLAITFLVSTLTQFFAPAEQAVIPLLVENRHLLSANSLYTTTMMASVIVGFAVGEPLLAIADRFLAPLDGGAGWGKAILVGAGYGIAGLLLLVMGVQEEPPDQSQHDRHPWQDIRDGLRYLGKNVQVRNAILQLVVLFSVFAALAVLAVRLAEVMPAIASSQFGFLLAAGGVGMALGAAAVGQFGQRFSRLVLSLYSSMGMGLMLVAMAFVTTQLWPTLLLIGGIGVCAAAIGIPMQTTIQEQTPAAMRGKVFGLQNNLVNIALSLPLVLASVAETFLGLPVVFGGLGAVVIAAGLSIAFWSDDGQPSSPQ
ncbi:MAG: MFS transporter [Cyanobacteria bacterium]|nr:MFS transporter [Cyanobacteriota bacterium]MDA0865935.1 MFS transporter [Cyanobacteriota bacterium]